MARYKVTLIVLYNHAATIIRAITSSPIDELIGKPLEKKIIAKNNKFIWGPEEDFWDKIPMGS